MRTAIRAILLLVLLWPAAAWAQVQPGNVVKATPPPLTVGNCVIGNGGLNVKDSGIDCSGGAGAFMLKAGTNATAAGFSNILTAAGNTPITFAPGLVGVLFEAIQQFQGITILNGAGNAVVKILCDNAAAGPANCDGGVIALYNGGASNPSIELLAGSNNSFFDDGKNLLLGANGKTITPDNQLTMAAGKAMGWETAGASDIGLSRISSGILGVGNGTAGSRAGTLQAGQGSFLTASQFTGVNIANATVPLFALIGTSASNDSALLKMFSGGVQTLQFLANGASWINNGHGFNIGGTSDPGSGALSVAGVVLAPGLASSSAATTGTLCWTTGAGNINVDTTVACLASDERLKNSIASLKDPLSEIARLQPITYRWNKDTPKAANDPGEHIGLGAFATAYVDERLIARGKDGSPRGWRQDSMIGLLVGAMQQQQAQITALQATVDRLSRK